VVSPETFEQRERSVVTVAGYRTSDGETTSDGDPLTVWINALPAATRDAYAKADLGDEAHRIRWKTADGGAASDPGNGCEFESRSGVFGDTTLYLRVIDDINIALLSLDQGILGRKVYKEAEARWSRCLRAAGFTMSSPLDMAAQAPPAQATADWDCRHSNGLTEARRQALVAEYEKRRDHLTRTLEAVRELNDHSEAQAKSILGS
jgi:hypothetical protein